ncbi:hypothetical protein B0J13DRAFT_427544, partial [Dactylonectria estremocensis]
MDPIDLGSSSRTTLKGPGDWKPWISIIQKHATASDVWAYLDPSKSDKPVLAVPLKPTYTTVKAQAAGLEALSADEFRRLEFLHNQYKTDLQVYRDKQKALTSIQLYITKTAGSYHTTIEDETDIAKQLSLLKDRVEPTSWNLEDRTLERFQSILKSPDRTKLTQWVISWQKVLTEAKKIDLPDAQGIRPTRHFLQAVSAINPAFSNFWLQMIENIARGGEKGWKEKIPDGIEISNMFEKQTPMPSMASKGGFSSYQ